MAKKKSNDEFKIGDIVKSIKNVDYKGRQVINFDKQYIITNIIDKKYIWLSSLRDGKYYQWAVMDVKNIKKVEE